MPVAPYALLWCNNNLLLNAVENYCCCLQRAFFVYFLLFSMFVFFCRKRHASCTAPYLINRTVHTRAPTEKKKENL